MIRISLLCRFALALGALALAATTPLAAAGTVGDPAPDFTLTDADGTTHTLSDYRGKVVVLEWINPNCPFSERHAKEKTMTRLAKSHGDVVWLAVNSTNPEHRDFLVPAAHLAFNRDHGITYPVLYDRSGDVGHDYDAKTTPHMYIIDEKGDLAYNGAIDDDPLGRQRAKERVNYVAVGLTEHAEDQPVDPATTKPYGCSVKY